MIIPPVRIFERPLRGKTDFALTPDQYLLVMPIGDIHYGAPGCAVERLKYHVAWGAERGAYFLGMGDYFDFGSASQAMLLRQLRNEQQEQLDDMLDEKVEELAEILEPSRNRWLGLLAGNHNYTGTTGFSMARRLCKKLRADWLADMGCVRLRLGPAVKSGQRDTRVRVTIVCHHGLGGGRRAGAGLLRLEEMPLSFPQGDVFLQAHNHTKVNTPLDPVYIAENGAQYHRTKVLARTGSWLLGYKGQLPPEPSEPDVLSAGTYIEKGLLMPAAIGGLVLSIGRKYDAGGEVWIPDIHYSV